MADWDNDDSTVVRRQCYTTTRTPKLGELGKQNSKGYPACGAGKQKHTPRVDCGAVCMWVEGTVVSHNN